MATGTNAQGVIARKNALQVLHSVRFKINWNDAGIATGVGTGVYLPKGALVKGTDVYITTAFNATSTNVLSIGTEASTYTNLATTAQTVSGTPGVKKELIATGLMIVPLAADSQIFYLYTQSGTAASAGVAYVVVYFNVDNDLSVGL